MTSVYSKRTEDILKKINIEKAPVPIEKVAELFAIKIIPYNFPENFSGLIQEVNGQMVIGVNKKHHPNRQRFTISHEIAHYLLGHSVGHSIGLTNDIFESNQSILEANKEKEANVFAGELLMPTNILTADIQRLRGKAKIPDLAKMYEVSEQAMSIRLLETGLIFQL